MAFLSAFYLTPFPLPKNIHQSIKSKFLLVRVTAGDNNSKLFLPQRYQMVCQNIFGTTQPQLPLQTFWPLVWFRRPLSKHSSKVQLPLPASHGVTTMAGMIKKCLDSETFKLKVACLDQHAGEVFLDVWVEFIPHVLSHLTGTPLLSYTILCSLNALIVALCILIRKVVLLGSCFWKMLYSSC